MKGVRSHAGVLITYQQQEAQIIDCPTGVDIIVNFDGLAELEEDAIDLFLLEHGLARASARLRRSLCARFGLPPARRSRVHEYGSARRISASPGAIGPICGTTRALSRAWAPCAAAFGIVLATILLSAGAALSSVVAAATAPIVAVIAIGAHETAHWMLLRIITNADAGAILVGWRTCLILHQPLSGWRRRAVAAVGPIFGLIIAISYAALGFGELMVTYTAAILAVSNAIGLLPISADGRELWRATD